MACPGFEGRLAEFLNFGQVLDIGAKTECNASWFSISLTTPNSNENEMIDIGLRISINLNRHLISYRQQIRGKWHEVDEDDFETDILCHEPFRVIILMEEKKFYISINNNKLTLVKYAFEVEKLNTVRIVGDLVSINRVDHRKYFPILWPPMQLREDELDFSHDMPTSFQPGHVMVITMKLLGKMDGGRFKMDFRNVWNCKILEAHISIRFDTKSIVRNSKLFYEQSEKVRYGSEEVTKNKFPFDFVPKTFKLAVAFTANSLKLAKDGGFLFSYNFRTPNVLYDLSGVKIMGINDMIVQVCGIDHFRMEDLSCKGFERYSSMKSI